MSIISAIIGSAVSSTPPTPPPVGTQWFQMNSDDPSRGFGGITDWWYSSVTGGGAYINSLLSSPPPAWTAYSYLDGSSGHVYEFTGNEYLFSPNLSQVNAWPYNSITIDYWFYPTSGNIQLLSEIDTQSVESAGYHYSMLEIDSSNYINAQFWRGQSFISVNTVNLNQWNHIWIKEDTQGGHSLELNGVPTNGNPVYFREKPSTEYFVIGYSDVTSMVTSNRFQGKVGLLTISNGDAPSTYDTYKTKFGLV